MHPCLQVHTSGPIFHTQSLPPQPLHPHTSEPPSPLILHTYRVFSLNPFKGYEPPVLAGHRDGIVSVFFSGEAMRKAAQVWRARRAKGDAQATTLFCVRGAQRHCQYFVILSGDVVRSGPAYAGRGVNLLYPCPLQVDGKDLPLLYTVSRDGAIFSWRFTPRPKGVPAKAPVAPAPAPAAASEDAETKGGAAAVADEEDEPVQDPSDFPFLARECSWLLAQCVFRWHPAVCEGGHIKV